MTDLTGFLDGQRYWSPDAPPPTLHNQFVPLIDGRDAMLAMYRDMLAARRSIDLVSWFLNPDFAVVRGHDRRLVPPASDGTYTIESPLADRARDGIAVRTLLWKGTFLGSMRAGMVKHTQRQLSLHEGLACAVDGTERLSHCHHQKALLVDGTIAYVGGLDFAKQDADRWDTQQHAARRGRNWHDVHCRFVGPATALIAENMAQRWHEVTGERLCFAQPTERSEPGVPLQVLRTLPKGVFSFAPEGDFGIDGAYLRAILQAKRFIYIENQYLWSPSITAALIETVRRCANDGFRLVILLPDRPNVGRADTDRNVRKLRDADGGRNLVRVCVLGKPDGAGRKSPPVYVHAKVCIVDDHWFTLGSANLNGRGLVSDTELNVASVHDDAARDLRLRLWSEHLEFPTDELARIDPCEAIDRHWPVTDGASVGMVESYRVGSWLTDLNVGLPEAVLLDL